MHGTIPAAAQQSIFLPATNGAETTAPESAAISGAEISGWFAELARKLWPKKTWAHLQYLTKAPDRTCQRWASGATDISSSALRDMLRSNDGERVLLALMDGCRQPWWLKRADDARAADGLRGLVEQLGLPLPRP